MARQPGMESGPLRPRWKQAARDSAGIRCQHCGEPGESATTTDNRSIQADACYGCRNRHYEARRCLERASIALDAARKLLGMVEADTVGVKAADGLAQVSLDVTKIRRELDQ